MRKKKAKAYKIGALSSVGLIGRSELGKDGGLTSG